MVLRVAYCVSVVLFVQQAFAFEWPTDDSSQYLISTFGPRCVDVGSPFHAGIDVNNPNDSQGLPAAVIAVDAGYVCKVSYYNEWSGYQYSVIVDHGTWFSGYHHLESLEDIWVEEGDLVEEGEFLASADNALHNHVHFNYWTSTPDDEDNTSHPFLIWGARGTMTLNVSGNSPDTCHLRVAHWGDLIEVGTSWAWCEGCSPSGGFQWDYESNVRNDMGVIHPNYYGGGDCMWGAEDAQGHISLAVSPTNFANDTETFFLFPCEVGQWILAGNYTYALRTNGEGVFIDHPVSSLFEWFEVSQEGHCVELSWKIDANQNDNILYIVERRIEGGTPFVSIEGPIVDDDGSCSIWDCVGRSGEREYKVSCYIDGEQVVVRSARVLVSSASVRSRINQMFPNPVLDEVNVGFCIPFDLDYVIQVFDVRGMFISEIARGKSVGGESNAVWKLHDHNGKRVPAGCYFVQLIEDGFVVFTKKAVVLR